LSCTYVLNCNRGNNKHSYDDDDDDDDDEVEDRFGGLAEASSATALGRVSFLVKSYFSVFEYLRDLRRCTNEATC